jgi:flagellar biosynthesis protein
MPYIKKAVALGYDEKEDQAPKVLAKAKGTLAQTIIKIAEDNDINIFSNEALVQSLMNIELQQNISPELYQSVAEVFAWLNEVNTKS